MRERGHPYRSILYRMRLVYDAGRSGSAGFRSWIARFGGSVTGIARLWIVEWKQSHEIGRPIDGPYNPNRTSK